ncbi:MAG: AAA family ATPase [Gammaproteobacteria bacterium]|nr:AAA family ATPase [Gammaproteobacteria bacterium]
MSSLLANNNDNPLIAALQDASIYDHEVANVSIIETHISWVVLTGRYAYKIKKPIKFSFVDFSTLEKRRFYCNEEMRLNSRLAPNLYIGVVAITGSDENPSFDQSGDAIEYAVKMRQFPQSSLLSYLSVHNQLSQKNIDDMAREISDFHLRIDRVASNAVLGSPEDIHHWVTDNFEQIVSNLTDNKSYSTLKSVKSWSENEYKKKYNQLQQRRENKFIRECHGDMHLDNMVLIENKVTIFDGIDFNEHLRWIDVISEIAFVIMDLSNRGHPEYASRFLNLYLQHTGDYEGLSVLKYYLVYRAVVRAKVALLRISQKSLSTIEQEMIQQKFNSYLTLALNYISDNKNALIITHGFSGSGKSTHTEKLLESLSAIRVRSDIERKRLYGFESSERTQSNINNGIYTAQSSKETYERLADLSKIILTSGFTVIVDACFLKHEIRQKFYKLAEELKVPFIILDFQASEDTLKQRITLRAKNRLEPSEADLEVLQYQLENHRPFKKQEKPYVLVANTEKEIQVRQIASAIKNHIDGLSI